MPLRLVVKLSQLQPELLQDFGGALSRKKRSETMTSRPSERPWIRAAVFTEVPK